jgi:hypothetical protein
MYRATVNSATLQALQRGGYDVTSVKETAAGVEVALVLTDAERDRLRGQGVQLRVWRDKQGHTQSQRAELQAANGFNVYRSYDEPGGIRDEMYELARQNPQLVKLEVLGETSQGREYIAEVDPGVMRFPTDSSSSALRGRTTPASGSLLRSTAPPALVHRPVAGQRQGHQAAAQGHRVVVRAGP